jgi:hypothetical protein
MIFTNHKLLEIELNTKIDLSAITVSKIYFKRPDGTQGQWNAVVKSGPEGLKYLSYTLTSNDNINQEGVWLLEPYIEVNGKPAPGDIVEMKVFKPLTGV